MDGLIVDIEVLSELVKSKAPDVHQHVINLGMYALNKGSEIWVSTEKEPLSRFNQSIFKKSMNAV